MTVRICFDKDAACAEIPASMRCKGCSVVTYGGCPRCGKQSCMALDCIAREPVPEGREDHFARADDEGHAAAPVSAPADYADWQQRRGPFADMVDEAISRYDSWMLEDSYDAQGTLNDIIGKLRERRSFYVSTPAAPVSAADKGGCDA